MRWPADSRALRALIRDPMGLMGLVLVTLFILMAVAAPLLAPYDPVALDVRAKLKAPSFAHWLGTDQLGRDTLSRIIYGARTALTIALTAIGLAGSIGILLGLIAGYGPRWLDAALVLIFDALNSLPMMMFALAIITVLGPGTGTLILVVVLVSIPGYARLIRAQTLSLRSADFILAEQAIGASTPRILLHHLLPNVFGPLCIVLSMDIPVVIMLEAGLSYLNLGVKPPTPSWGNILYDGYTAIRTSSTLVIAAGAPLVLATLGFTFLGEGLRDALDPRFATARPR
ncbi:ABC transporter permease [Cypionkella sinensis]|uniref:ABC transporter permease n=1 Tax=Cypionkella sinensis TaxID=1756043 RepID=A0ABV7J7R7_9RHOB